MDERPDREREADRQTRALAGLAFVLALVVIALFVVKHLRIEGELEDCLLAQRTNCDALIDHER